MAGTRNDTPDTPEVRESAIATMKVDELRRKLRGHGVKGTAELKKPELVKKLIKAEVAATKSSASAKPAKSAKSSASAKPAKSSASAKPARSAKNPTPGNDTPNTPDVSESAIAATKADVLRRKLRGHGVKGTADLKKPELVKKLIKAEVAAAKSASAKPAKPAKPVQTAKPTKPARSAKNPTSGNDTPNTPDVSESAIAAMKADDLRRKLRGHGVKGTAAFKKPELVSRLIEIETANAEKTTKSAKPTGSARAGKSAGTAPAGKAAKAAKGTQDKAGGIRSGKAAAKSLKYSQEITSTADRPERDGRSLVTTDHEVIRQWAKARKAVPSTVKGTEHDGHLGVLRFDFPGYSGDRLTAVEWDQWLATFDKRRLNFIYQQRQSSGKRSNFFRLENPDE